MSLMRTHSYDADLYQEIVHSSAYSYLVFERGICTYASPSYWSLVGYETGEELDTAATALRELLHPEDRDAVLLAFADAVARQDPEISMLYRGRRKDGTYTVRHDLARLLYDSEGHHVKTYVAVRELPPTEAARNEEMIRGHARLHGELLHRTKNDLSLVRSLLQLQADNATTAEAQAALRAAAYRIDAVGHIYDHLQHVHRTRDTDLTHMLKTFLGDLLEKIGLEQASVEIRLPPGLVVSARISTAVAIIFNELVTNVAKYTDIRHGDFQLTIGVSADDAARQLILQMRDTGPGFPPEVEDGSRSGFGLEMVRALVSQHQGTITLSSDHGAVVDISIPLDPTY